MLGRMYASGKMKEFFRSYRQDQGMPSQADAEPPDLLDKFDPTVFTKMDYVFHKKYGHLVNHDDPGDRARYIKLCFAYVDGRLNLEDYRETLREWMDESARSERRGRTAVRRTDGAFVPTPYSKNKKPAAFVKAALLVGFGMACVIGIAFIAFHLGGGVAALVTGIVGYVVVMYPVSQYYEEKAVRVWYCDCCGAEIGTTMTHIKEPTEKSCPRCGLEFYKPFEGSPTETTQRPVQFRKIHSQSPLKRTALFVVIGMSIIGAVVLLAVVGLEQYTKEQREHEGERKTETRAERTDRKTSGHEKVREEATRQGEFKTGQAVGKISGAKPQAHVRTRQQKAERKKRSAHPNHKEGKEGEPPHEATPETEPMAAEEIEPKVFPCKQLPDGLGLELEPDDVFDAVWVDLNHDGTTELLFRGSRGYCGSAGCESYVFMRDPDVKEVRWKTLVTFGQNYGITIHKHIENGFHNLSVMYYVDTNVREQRFLRWNGTQYEQVASEL